ncbi:hypothetical protein K438DRAFT_1930088 [Mycena galopus ATCC 62051]|nr:hypothetical protein K438DRAFT_1930088 [Mycena galopus ATCC 62051]
MRTGFWLAVEWCGGGDQAHGVSFTCDQAIFNSRAASVVTLDVKPWDDETDMEALEKCVRSIEQDGVIDLAATLAINLCDHHHGRCVLAACGFSALRKIIGFFLGLLHDFVSVTLYCVHPNYYLVDARAGEAVLSSHHSGSTQISQTFRVLHGAVAAVMQFFLSPGLAFQPGYLSTDLVS